MSIDTGASVNLISTRILEDIVREQPEIEVKRHDRQFRVAGGGILDSQFYICTNIGYKDKLVKDEKVYVSSNPDEVPLLSRHTLKKLGFSLVYPTEDTVEGDIKYVAPYRPIKENLLFNIRETIRAEEFCDDAVESGSEALISPEDKMELRNATDRIQRIHQVEEAQIKTEKDKFVSEYRYVPPHREAIL